MGWPLDDGHFSPLPFACLSLPLSPDPPLLPFSYFSYAVILTMLSHGRELKQACHCSFTTKQKQV